MKANAWTQMEIQGNSDDFSLRIPHSPSTHTISDKWLFKCIMAKKPLYASTFNISFIRSIETRKLRQREIIT